MEFCDSNWVTLAKPVFVSFEPVHIKIFMKDAFSSTVRVRMNSDSLREDRVVYSYPLKIGIDSLDYHFKDNELRVTLNVLRSGKTTGLVFSVDCEVLLNFFLF